MKLRSVALLAALALLGQVTLAQCWTIPCRTGATAAASGGGGITVVQGGTSSTAKECTSSPCSLAYPSNVGANHCLVIASALNGTSTFSVTDSLSDTISTDVTNAGVVGIFHTKTTGGADTVTISASGVIRIYIELWEVSGLANCSLDKTGTSSDSGAALSVATSASTTQANEFSLVAFNDHSTNGTITPTSPYAGYGILGGSGDETLLSAYDILSSTGTQTADATDSNSSDTTYNIIATLD